MRLNGSEAALKSTANLQPLVPSTFFLLSFFFLHGLGVEAIMVVVILRINFLLSGARLPLADSCLN